MELKYEGESVKNGDINIEDLIIGLQGLASINNIVNKEILHHSYSNIKIKSFKKGSFKVVLDFIEQYPTLFYNATTLFVCFIYIFLSYPKKTKNNIKNITIDNIDFEKIPNEITKEKLSAILYDKTKKNKLFKAFHDLHEPLNENNISHFIIRSDNEEIMSTYKEKKYFYIKELGEEIHKTIKLYGSIRSLDKKTNYGKFVSADKNIYPFI